MKENMFIGGLKEQELVSRANEIFSKPLHKRIEYAGLFYGILKQLVTKGYLQKNAANIYIDAFFDKTVKFIPERGLVCKVI